MLKSCVLVFIWFDIMFIYLFVYFIWVLILLCWCDECCLGGGRKRGLMLFLWFNVENYVFILYMISCWKMCFRVHFFMSCYNNLIIDFNSCLKSCVLVFIYLFVYFILRFELTVLMWWMLLRGRKERRITLLGLWRCLKLLMKNNILLPNGFTEPETR